MTPAARLTASIEVLDRLAGGSAPADRVLKAWGQANRYAGSGDRRAITERVFACLRERGRLVSAMGAADGRALVIGSLGLLDRLDVQQVAALFNGQGHAPAPLSEGETARLEALDRGDGLGLPAFIVAQFEEAFAGQWPSQAAALLRGRAALDLRLNTARGSADRIEAVLSQAGVSFQRTPYSALGLRVDGSPDLVSLPAFAGGLFEVQDESSQIAAFLAASDPSAGLVVDYCAGGGGKTLALALDGPRLIACDVDQRRLDAIIPRLARSGAVAELRRIGHEGQGTDDLVGRADLVLVDAPCSASGTWRRRPDAAWRLTAEALAALAVSQAAILARAAMLVAPGGRLAYVTCSVLPAENAAIAAAFAAGHPHFRPLPIAQAAQTPNLTDAARERLAALSAGGHTLQLSPLATGADGFFVALFERKA